MRCIILCKVWFLLFLIGCQTDNQDFNNVYQSNNCFWLNHDSAEFVKLFKNDYAQSVSDSFIYSWYINYYKKKVKAINNISDSMSVLELRVIPKLLGNPRGDSDVYDIAYGFTDINCYEYYDSVLKSQEAIVYGIRFSLLEKKVICYLSSDHTLLIDSSFMDVQKIIKQPDFIKEIERNKQSITDEKLLLFLNVFLQDSNVVITK